MSAASISEFDWRLVNQQRKINDCGFRLFDLSKYLTTLRSNISPCQKATTLILIPLYNPSFHPWNHQKNLWALPYFCLGCLLKSATVTSFSQLHLSRNTCCRQSLEQINLHFSALCKRWLIKKDKKCVKFSRFFVGKENFTFSEIHVDEKSREIWRFANISKYGFCMVQNIHSSIIWLFIIISAHLRRFQSHTLHVGWHYYKF